ncbi:MAG: 30S ribosomal protein S6 [Patescibacteria group bacterium]
MQKYELLYILPIKYTDEEIVGVVKNLTEEMRATGVNILRAEQVGKLKLAYPIKHQRYGYYILASFEAEEETLKKLQNYFKMNLEIMRSAIYRADSKKVTAAVVALKEMGELRPDARPRYEERRAAPAHVPAHAPQPAPALDKPKMSMEELDKKLDEILEGDIV